MENLSTQGNTGLDLDVYSLITGKVRDVKTDPHLTKQKFSETKIVLHFEISNRVQI